LYKDVILKFNLEKNEAVFITFLALLGATPPLSTDMYLAAIPKIALEWGFRREIINLSLVMWFVSFSISLLIFGPLSDRFGRKPVLLGGLMLFVGSSIMCSLSTNPVQLIIFRIFQGMGAASPSAMVIAICRDKYDGLKRQQALAYIGIILAIAPMVAPMIGAFIMEYTSWRMIFVTQSAMVLISFMLSLSFAESIKEKNDVKFFKLLNRYIVLFKNKRFLAANFIMGLAPAPLYGFIAFSPILYISIFGLSEKMFSVLFGLNALSAMAGSFVCTRLTKKIKSGTLITTSLSGQVISGCGIIFTGHIHPGFFAFFMAIFSFFLGMSRPLNYSLIVEQVDTDIGSASSFMVFYQFLAGALCMSVVTIHVAKPVLYYGLISAGISSFVLLLWLRYNKKFKRID